MNSMESGHRTPNPNELVSENVGGNSHGFRVVFFGFYMILYGCYVILHVFHIMLYVFI